VEPERLILMRSWAAAGVLTLCCAGCGTAGRTTSPAETAPATAATSTEATTEPTATSAAVVTTTSTPGPTIRVEIADGCPASVAGYPDNGNTAAMWIANPDATGLDATFVPDTPSAALICRYSAIDTANFSTNGPRPDEGALFTSTVLDAESASTLASNLNDIVPWDFVAGCLPATQGARYTAIVFEIPGRSDIDLWLKDWVGCPEVGNGVRTSGLLVNGQGAAFLATLDADAPPAPDENFLQPG
jgi:hypothetical protein